MTIPLHLQLSTLSLKAVLLRCLDIDGNPVKNAFASGFIRKEKSQLFLYTCWHVVTGYDKNNIEFRRRDIERMFLEVSLQDVEEKQPGVTVIGGRQSIVIPLYDTTASPPRPLWSQNEQHVPHPDLNPINLRVPFWHDAVKLPLPSDVRISDLQIIEEENSITSNVTIGDKVLIVGYPYGFSVSGTTQPTPIVLTRFVASTNIADRQQELLLESIGAPGMSGGPVFIEKNSNLLLLGLYTGLIYPDHLIEKNDRTTALGTCSDMMICWNHLPLVPFTPETGHTLK